MTTQIEKAKSQLEVIMALRAKGKTQQAIAEELGLTQPVVSLALRSSGGDPFAPALPVAPAPLAVSPMHLVARNPHEMAAAQTDLQSWLERKIDSVASEVAELSGALDEAIANGWKSATLKNQQRRASTRRLFYEKCLAATRAGYTMIPDIPLDIFAIRTSRSVPRRNTQHAKSPNYQPDASMPDEAPQILAPGEGDYKNPAQLVEGVRGSYADDKGKEVNFHTLTAVGYDDLEFPVIAAVPSVMSATQRAMAFRVFDQIGISPQGSVRAADPLIIGQILGVQSGWTYRKTASFLIAWHLDLRTL
jgi:hypothetical protein